MHDIESFKLKMKIALKIIYCCILVCILCIQVKLLQDVCAVEIPIVEKITRDSLVELPSAEKSTLDSLLDVPSAEKITRDSLVEFDGMIITGNTVNRFVEKYKKYNTAVDISIVSDIGKKTEYPMSSIIREVNAAGHFTINFLFDSDDILTKVVFTVVEHN